MSRITDIQRERMNDSVLQLRCDRRTIATLAEFFFNDGEQIMSLSQLGRMAIEELRQILVDNNLVDDVLSTEDATKTLDRLGMGNLNPRGKGKRNYTKALRIEQRIFSPIVREGSTRIKKKALEGMKEVTDDLTLADVNEAREEIEQKLKNERKVNLSKIPDGLIKEE